MVDLGSSRKLAMVALLTAVAVVLNGISVPAPYEPFLLYGVWEVPILLALLIVGIWGGVASAAMNALALEVLNPGQLPTGPLYNFIAELAMFAGVLAAVGLARRRGVGMEFEVATATAAGALMRTGVMTVVNWLVLPQAPPIGFSIPVPDVSGFLVFIGLFNFTVVLYTVPLAFTLRRAVAPKLAMVGQAKVSG